jgi:eukaryotic-like serine/threonine-protein kinase
LASPSAPDDRTSAPKQFGQYTVVRKLGDGGMGTVYEARHDGLGKRVAIKVLLPEMASKDEIAQRFVREGQAAARIRHPHVVDVYDVGAEEGSTWLVMELLEGSDLESALAKGGAMSVAQTLAIVLPVISAVGAAHREGVVHRDLKPANIFLSKDSIGRVLPKVVDFGISKIMQEDRGFDLTKSAAVLGTPYYMAPEQVHSIKRTDARSDQYSLGVILYECLTGRHPFTGESLFELMTSITTTDATPVHEVEASVPVGVSEVVRRAMSRDPAQRFPSVRELGQALIPFADELTRAMWTSEFGGSQAAREPAARPNTSAAAVSHTAVESAGTIASFEAESRSAAHATRAASAGRRKLVLALAAASGLIAIAAVALWQRHPAPPATAEPSPSQPALPVVESSAVSAAPSAVLPAAALEPAPTANDAGAASASASARLVQAKAPSTTHGKKEGGSGGSKQGDGVVRGANSAYIIH